MLPCFGLKARDADVIIGAIEFRDEQLPITIQFPSGQIKNPCQFSVALTDKNSDRRIDIYSELIIE